MALRHVCEALQPYADARSIRISCRVDQPASGLTAEQITSVALVVNELVTNAIKHAFRDSVGGRIIVAIGRSAGGDLLVTVEDDGLPYPDFSARDGRGLGLGFATRLIASVGGRLVPQAGEPKVFELTIPAADA